MSKKYNCHVCKDTGEQVLFVTMVPCDWCILGGSKKSQRAVSSCSDELAGIPIWHVPDDGSTWHLIPLCTGNKYSMIQYPVPAVACATWDNSRTLVYLMNETGSQGRLVWYETGSQRAQFKMDEWLGDGTLSKYAFTVCRTNGSTKYANNVFAHAIRTKVHPSVLLDALAAWDNR